LLVSQFEIFTQIINLDATISINPRQTYLRINNDPGILDSLPLDLDSLGISGKDSLMLQQLGDYDNGPSGDEYDGMMAFSVQMIHCLSHLNPIGFQERLKPERILYRVPPRVETYRQIFRKILVLIQLS
jgi:hypothetical protein